MTDVETLDRVSNSNADIIACFQKISLDRKIADVSTIGRFLIFAHDVPSDEGGWNDLQATADSIYEARGIARRLVTFDRYDLVYIIDLKTGDRVAQ